MIAYGAATVMRADSIKTTLPHAEESLGGLMFRFMQVSLLTAVVLGVGALQCAAEDVISVNESQALKAVISKVEPVYPPMAKQMRITGQVAVSAFVDTSGKVEKVEVVSGNALLARACVTAVESWKFSPFQAEGKPVKAVAHLAFAFHL